MRRALVWLTISFILGIVFADNTRLNFFLFFYLGVIDLILAIVLSKSRCLSALFIFLAAFCAGAGCLKNSYHFPRSHIWRILFKKSDSLCALKGIAITPSQQNGNTRQFVMAANEVIFKDYSYHCCGKVLVELGFPYEISYGDELFLKGRLYRLTGRKGFSNWHRYLGQQGIFIQMRVVLPGALTTLAKGKGFWFKRLALNFKRKVETLLFASMPRLTAGIMDAMVLGEKQHIPFLVYERMIRCGTVHILVVSGFNVGVVVFMCTLLFKVLRLCSSLRLVLTILCVSFYCLCAGAQAAVVRATVMAIFFLCGQGLQRDPDAFISCSVAALFILLLQPRQIFDIGFQLSFASVLGIIGIYPPFRSLFGCLNRIRQPLLRGAVNATIVSFSAWIATAGLVAIYFKIFSPVTILANIFIAPLATIITLSGFTLVGVASLFPILTAQVARTCQLLVILLLRLSFFFSQLPGAYLFLTRNLPK